MLWVAPRRGAWVETMRHLAREWAASSHPAGVRGLKPSYRNSGKKNNLSHPAGVRGLKLFLLYYYVDAPMVAPRRGAWVETPTMLGRRKIDEESHPAGVRGLKLRCLY